MSGLVTAVSFLTRVPVGDRRERDLATAVPWFPVVGALVGLAVAGAYAGAASLIPRLVAAPIAVGIGALITGGFHEDGLADTADALGSRADREDALRILHDPRLGTFGVLALTLTVLIRVAAIASLSPMVAFAVIPAAHILSRGAVVAALLAPPASEQGLGAAVRATPRTVLVGMLVAVALAAAIAGWWTIAFAAAAAIPAAALVLLARRRIGGITGDILGAVQQSAESAILVVGATGLLSPWWA